MNNDINYETVIISEDMMYDEETLLSYRIEYPNYQSIAFGKAAATMNSFYLSRALEKQSYYRQRLYDAALEDYNKSKVNNSSFQPYIATVTFLTTFNQDCTISLYFDEYEFRGAGFGITHRVSYTWDLQQGRRMYLGQFFKPPILYVDYVDDLVIKQIADHFTAGGTYYFQDYDNRVLKSFNPENFFLTPIGVIIYFQEYEIAPYSSGIPQFLIEYSDHIVPHPKCN